MRCDERRRDAMGCDAMVMRCDGDAMRCDAVQCDAMRCYAMLCYAMRRDAVLCDAMLCDVTLCYAVLCYAMLCYAMLCDTGPVAAKTYFSSNITLPLMSRSDLQNRPLDTTHPHDTPTQ